MSRRPIRVALTFDVDADQANRHAAPGAAADPNATDLSIGTFAIRRGLPRILELLDELGARATFFVPGATADAHPDAIAGVHDRGHEIAHHGHHHFGPSEIDEAQQLLELDRGSAALERCTGAAPVGYRAPELKQSAFTLDALAARGFDYDSSLMADDRPYALDGGLVELPVHWSLDDFPHLGYTARHAGPLRDPAAVFALWAAEIASAIDDGRDTVLCLHPEVIGRGWIFGSFAAFARGLRDDERVALVPCAEIAAAHLSSKDAR
jgi:peptidoglycan/xylan/chitin deacetylase (PgdA/CDA1 family)